MNIFDKFELKLKENIENNKIKNKQINESEIRFKAEADERQRVQQLYETQLQKCRELKDLLSKLETDYKIASEKQSIEYKEEKNLNLNKIERMSQQLNQLKYDMNVIQSKGWHLEQTLLQKETQLQKQNTLRLTIESELSQIQNKCQSLTQEFKRLSQNQTQLKEIVKSSGHLNDRMREQLNQYNQQLIDVNKENSDLKTLVSQLKEKCVQTEEALNDSELQSLRLTQQNDLQKQEIKELRDLLQESIHEKEFLTKHLNKSHRNANESEECELNNEELTSKSQTIDITSQ